MNTPDASGCPRLVPGDHVRAAGRARHGIYISAARVIAFETGQHRELTVRALTVAQFANGKAVRRVRHHPWAPASIWLGGDRVPSRAIARAEAMLADRADYARYTHGFGYVQAADWCALGSCPRARTATVIAVLLAVDVLMQWAYAWSAPERTIRVFALAVAVIWALRSVHRGRFIAPTSSRHHDTRSPCAAPPTGPGHGCGRRPGPPRGRRALPESGMNGRKNLRLTAVRASRNGRAGCRRPVEHTTPAAPDRYAGGGPQ